MSDTALDFSPSGDEPEIVAAEYVLGTLDLAEAEAARLRIEADRGFAALVTAWERRLAPLAALVAAITPPAGLWARIEDSTGRAATSAAPAPGPRPANDNGGGFWRVTALAFMAIAAGLAAFIVLRPPPRPIVAEAVVSRPYVAVLSPASGGAAVLLAVADSNGAIRITPSAAIVVPADRDLELWSLPAGAAKPASLGVLPVSGKSVRANGAEGMQLLVSLEPKGGSPTGQPTGAVVYAGKLAIAD